MVTPFAKTAIIAVAASVLAAGTTFAQSPMQEQRTDQVQDRVQDTNQRINEEYRQGSITRNEARELKEENREIAHDARDQARDGAGLSHGEQRDINQQQNTLNREITRQSQQ
ncbi:hypothetical protein BH10PSE6_BH10PSE6_24050 [soil metagenome]